jgi:hypothetical protein
LISHAAGEIIIEPKRIGIACGIDIASHIRRGNDFELVKRRLPADPGAQFRCDDRIGRIHQRRASLCVNPSISVLERVDFSSGKVQPFAQDFGAVLAEARRAPRRRKIDIDSEKGSRVVRM